MLFTYTVLIQCRPGWLAAKVCPLASLLHFLTKKEPSDRNGALVSRELTHEIIESSMKIFRCSVDDHHIYYLFIIVIVCAVGWALYNIPSINALYYVWIHGENELLFLNCLRSHSSQVRIHIRIVGASELPSAITVAEKWTTAFVRTLHPIVSSPKLRQALSAATLALYNSYFEST